MTQSASGTNLMKMLEMLTNKVLEAEELEKENEGLKRSLDSLRTEYEELRAIIDGSSESMTHEEAVADLAYSEEHLDHMSEEIIQLQHENKHLQNQVNALCLRNWAICLSGDVDVSCYGFHSVNTAEVFSETIPPLSYMDNSCIGVRGVEPIMEESVGHTPTQDCIGCVKWHAKRMCSENHRYVSGEHCEHREQERVTTRPLRCTCRNSQPRLFKAYGPQNRYMVYCCECNNEGKICDTEQEAIEQWNLRIRGNK